MQIFCYNKEPFTSNCVCTHFADPPPPLYASVCIFMTPSPPTAYVLKERPLKVRGQILYPVNGSTVWNWEIPLRMFCDVKSGLSKSLLTEKCFFYNLEI